MTYYLPRYQAQNPAKSGDEYGWENCMAYAAAMMADFDSQGDVLLTGEQVRAQSSEPIPDPRSPGLTLWQARDVLARHGVTLTPYKGVSFDWAVSVREAGHALVWCVSYAPIHHTSYSGDWNFTGNHAIGQTSDGETWDPLTDGRVKPYSAGGGRYPQGPQRIPDSLMRSATGQLLLDPKTGQRLGAGKAYVGVLSHAFPFPPPVEDDMTITDIVAGDYTTKAGRTTPAPIRSHPVRGSRGVIGSLALGATIRTIAKVTAGDDNWRLTEYAGKPAYLLRADLDPVANVDPSLDSAFGAFIARKSVTP